jgi:hypothetical protein
LRGPLDRAQIKSLGQTNITQKVKDIETSLTRPFVNGHKEYFVKGDKDSVYVPTLFFRLNVSYKYQPAKMVGDFETIVIGHDIRNFTKLEYSFNDIVPANGQYKNLPVSMDDYNIDRLKMKALEWATMGLKPFILINETLRVWSYVGTSESAFYEVCRQAESRSGEQFSDSQVEKVYIDISKRSIQVKEIAIIWIPQKP